MFHHGVALVALLALANSLPAQAGALDSAFGASGVVTLAGGGQFRGVTVQADGKIVAVGYEGSASNRRWLVHRCHPDGSADLGFGSGGVVALFPFGSSTEAYDVEIDSVGRLVIAGSAVHGSGRNEHNDIAVVRLQGTNGALDPSFGSGGVVLVHAASKSSSGSQAWAGLEIQGDGKIVVGGWAGGAKSLELALARLTTNGTLDPTFGSSGVVRDVVSANDDLPWFGAMTLQPDGRILLGAERRSFPVVGWIVSRYQTNGALDTTWGSGGRLIGDFSGFSWERVSGFALEPSGHVIAAGRARNDLGPSLYDACLTRTSSSGAYDVSFGIAGFAHSDLLGDDQAIAGVVRFPDGSLVLGVMKDSHAQLMRFTSGGQLDTSYGTGGLSAIAWGGLPWALEVDAMTRVVLVGQSGGSAAIARYLSQ